MLIVCNSYVQMLENQHAQLVAGLQDLYFRTQNGRGWTSTPLELVKNGQPLTHKILEGLGILGTDKRDDEATQGSISSWVSVERQNQEESGNMYDISEATSPTVTTPFSPTSAAQASFPGSTMKIRRRSKYEISSSQILDMPSMTVPQSWHDPYSSEQHLPQSGHCNQGTDQQAPLPASLFGSKQTSIYCSTNSNSNYVKEELLPFGDLQNNNAGPVQDFWI